ncbi:MAG: hypothetical protein QOK19_1854 [Solirubrobacteraceae bacterium]|nr:hypothetical protein [Solirubrobacteraceae bacterium]
MFVSSSRHTASTLRNLLAAALVAGLATLAGSSTAMASTDVAPEAEANQAPAQVNAELAVCPGQTFSQPFAALGDSAYYTLVEGSTFDRPGEGWTLLAGARIVEGPRPDGSQGGVLDLPSGAVAISPPVCVTLQYPTARTWVEALQSSGSVTASVVYGAGTGKQGGAALNVGSISGRGGSGWNLSQPFNLEPQLAGNEEGVRSARFVYSAGGSRRADFHVFGLYVDPRFGN